MICNSGLDNAEHDSTGSGAFWSGGKIILPPTDLNGYCCAAGITERHLIEAASLCRCILVVKLLLPLVVGVITQSLLSAPSLYSQSAFSALLDSRSPEFLLLLLIKRLQTLLCHMQKFPFLHRLYGFAVDSTF